jgi:hypothetical protein
MTHMSRGGLLTAPCDWCMHKIQKAAGQSARRLTDLLTRPHGTGETTRDAGDAQRGLCLVSETGRNAGDGGDARRMAHNPEVAGSNPAPATSFRSSRPFPITERAFCASRNVVKGVVGAGLRAAWQRDGRDGVTRGETAWTWWTLLPAISGCLARRYSRAHRSVRVRVGRAGTRVVATC